MYTRFQTLPMLFLVLSWSPLAIAQNELFIDDQTLKISISVDLGALRDDVGDSRIWHSAQIKRDEQGANIPVKLKG